MNLRNLFEDEKKHLIVSYILISILLFLRFIILAAIGGLTRSIWTVAIYEIGTYFFTAILIFWERKRLADFNMDSIAVLFFIILKPIETVILKYHNNLLSLNKPLGIIIWTVSIGLVISLIIGKYRPDRITRNTFPGGFRRSE